MKPLRYTLIALAAACGFANAQTTATTIPVGYTTRTCKPGVFTLVGLTLHEPTKSAGVITGESATSVTVGTTDWVALLGAPTDPDPAVQPKLTYILELPDGTIQEITSWNTTGELMTPDDITAKVVPNTTTYKLRKAATVSSIFGAANTAISLTAATDVANADTVLIPNSSGSFDTVFYYNDGAGTEGWIDTDGGLAADKVIVYADSIYVNLLPTSPSKDLVVVGELKREDTGGVLVDGYNYLNGVAPVGLTLDSSMLKDDVMQATTLENADAVLIQNNTDYGYITCFYFNDGAGSEGWIDTDGGLAGGYSLDGGFLLERKPQYYTIDPPAGPFPNPKDKEYKVITPAFYKTL